MQLGAVDLGFKGQHYTWINRQVDSAFIKERLDRAICCASWHLLYEKAGVQHLVVSAQASDNSPIFVKLVEIEENRPKSFRFFSIWLRDETCKGVVEKTWRADVGGNASYRLARKLDATRKVLKVWNVQHFGNCQTRIATLERKLEEIQSRTDGTMDLVLEKLFGANLEE